MKSNFFTLSVLVLISVFIAVVFLNAPATASAGAAVQTQEDLKKTVEIHRQAYRKPFDKEAVNAYIKTLPRDGDYYVVEGDLLLTEQELIADLVSKSMGPKAADSTAELIPKCMRENESFTKIRRNAISPTQSPALLSPLKPRMRQRSRT